MIQRRNRARLAFKPLRELLRGNLDGNIAAETWITRPIYLAHPTCADRGEDLVGTEMSPGRERHRSMNDSNLRVGRSQRTRPGRRRGALSTLKAKSVAGAEGQERRYKL
jgi:hypothetical protein